MVPGRRRLRGDYNNVLRCTVGRGMLLLAMGSALGLATAFAFSRFLKSPLQCRGDRPGGVPRCDRRARGGSVSRELSSRTPRRAGRPGRGVEVRIVRLIREVRWTPMKLANSITLPFASHSPFGEKSGFLASSVPGSEEAVNVM